MKVRKMKKMKIFDSVVAIIATFFTYLFGGWDVALSILITFMILDYITGVIWAYIQKILTVKLVLKALLRNVQF